MPGGMGEKNVEVKFANGVLTIKGEKQEEREEKKKGYHMSERSFGSFERAFQVPEGIDADKIKASFKKGVLAITLLCPGLPRRWRCTCWPTISPVS